MVRKPQRGRLSSVPSGHPLRFFLGARGVFVCKGINFTDSPGWVKKVTACSRWLFFGTGCWGIVGWIYGVSGMCCFIAYFIYCFILKIF